MNLRSLPRRTHKRDAPASLPDHFARKGYLSVSDLVGPSWCEYNYQYSILSLSHLPPALRPTSIITPSGTTIAPSPQLLLEKDATLTAGKAVHTVLERQVAPVQVLVETESNEDAWALRLLNLWCDVTALLQLDVCDSKANGKGKGKEKACVREIPVYGWVDGVLVMGVVDEIEKRALSIGAGQKTGEGKDKKWASQEEWKKSQLRKDTSAKKSNGARTLTSFFASSSQTESPTAEAQTLTQETKKDGWGYFLSDTKTRISSWLPAEEDQFSARMQCMTYKRLLDGLLLGALSSQPFADSACAPLSFDPNATPMDWKHTFSTLELDEHRPLSSSFVRDATEVCASWGTDLERMVAETAAEACTLDRIRLLLEQALRSLVQDANAGNGGKVAPVIQDSLALTYRRQGPKSARTGKRKKRSASQDTTPATTGEPRALRQTTLLDTVSSAEEQDEAEAKADVVQVIAEGEDARNSIQSLEGQVSIEQAFDSPALPHTSSSRNTPKDPPSPVHKHSTEPSPSSILGIVTFLHSAGALDAYLQRMLAMWRGLRPLQGVSVDQTRRCWSCEWRQACEWRQVQSSALLLSSKLSHTPAGVAVDQDHHNPQDNQQREDDDNDEFWSTLTPHTMQVRDAHGNLLDW